jgi:hypothetical protein
VISKAIIFHPMLETDGLLPAPPELHGVEILHRLTRQQIFLHHFRILFLLGDGVADDRDVIAGHEAGVGRETKGTAQEEGEAGEQAVGFHVLRFLELGMMSMRYGTCRPSSCLMANQYSSVGIGCGYNSDMSKASRHSLQLDYASGRLIDRPRFRFGIVSLSLAVIAAVIPLVNFSTEMSASVVGLLFRATAVLCVVGIGSGIGGLFQAKGRKLALFGLALSLFDCFLLLVCPAFARA